MSLTNIVSTVWSSGSRRISQSVSRSNAATDSLQEVVPGPSTNLQLTYTLDVSAAKSIFLLCDQDLTVKTNSTGAPAATVSLKADVPLWWDSEAAYFTNPFGSTDITTLYVTTAATEDATFYLEVLRDSTP